MERTTAEATIDEAAFLGGITATARVASASVSGIMASTGGDAGEPRPHDDAIFVAACTASEALARLEAAIADRRMAFRAAAGVE